MDEQSVPDPVRKHINLAEFAPPGWFADRSKSSFWLRIYTILGIPHSELFSLVQGLPNTLAYEGEIQLTCGLMSGLLVPDFKVDLVASEDGHPSVRYEINQKALEDATYFFLARPYKIDGVPGVEFKTKEALDQLSAVIRGHLGLNFLRDIVFEGEVNATDGNFSVAGGILRMPQHAEGPYLAPQNWTDVSEIISAVSRLNDPLRRRIQLSLRFFYRSFEFDLFFFNFWTALEVLCDGTAPKIRSVLQRAYQLARQHDVDSAFGFATLSRMRHDLMHKGVQPRLNVDCERYLQLVYLDALRHVLALPPRHHAIGMLSVRGYDLRPLGLPDNRTNEQKARAEAAGHVPADLTQKKGDGIAGENPASSVG